MLFLLLQEVRAVVRRAASRYQFSLQKGWPAARCKLISSFPCPRLPFHKLSNFLFSLFSPSPQKCLFSFFRKLNSSHRNCEDKEKKSLSLLKPSVWRFALSPTHPVIAACHYTTQTQVFSSRKFRLEIVQLCGWAHPLQHANTDTRVHRGTGTFFEVKGNFSKSGLQGLAYTWLAFTPDKPLLKVV